MNKQIILETQTTDVVAIAKQITLEIVLITNLEVIKNLVVITRVDNYYLTNIKEERYSCSSFFIHCNEDVFDNHPLIFHLINDYKFQ